MLARLPAALAATEAGLLTVGHLWCLEEHVAPLADPVLRAEVEGVLLDWVAGRAAKGTITTPGQLAEKVLRELARRNARDRAQEAIRALAKRGVRLEGERGVGLAGLGVVGTVPEIEALHAALSACVDALPKDPSDTRTREQKLLDVLLDLVLRPGESGLPPVQVVLTLVASVQTALGGDQPAELNGRIVSAETARQLLNALTGAGLGDGALAELRRIAEEDAERVPPEPVGTAPDSEDFADWERQCQAEDDDPDPMPDDVWLASVEARLASGEIELELDRELAAAQDRWWREYAAGLHPDPDPDDHPEPAPTEPSPTDPPPGGGWWASAERALEEARAAQEQAECALARAGGQVRQAVWSDAEDEQAWRTGSGGRVDAAEDAMTALRAATIADRTALTDLLRRTAGGGLAERPRLALVDALTGALVSLTDLPALGRAVRDGRALGAPPPTGGYRPGAELDRFLRRRDRRCRFPGCRLPVSKGELDHFVRWPEGPTDAINLAGFCTGDHRGKHQAPGFTHAMTADGTLVVTTPSGITATTDPTPF
nr:HNH endonuclease [Petropleomorpha daqingensis]